MNLDWIWIAITIVSVLVIIKWVMKIYAAEDGDRKLSLNEFRKASAYLLFVWAFIYIIIKEANRAIPPDCGEHIFSETWMFFIITGLLTVLALESIFDTLKSLLELAIRFRTGKSNEQPKQDLPPAG